MRMDPIKKVQVMVAMVAMEENPATKAMEVKVIVAIRRTIIVLMVNLHTEAMEDMVARAQMIIIKKRVQEHPEIEVGKMLKRLKESRL